MTNRIVTFDANESVSHEPRTFLHFYKLLEKLD